MKAKTFWTIIGIVGLGLMLLFSKTLSLFNMSDNLHECTFVVFSIISIFSFCQVNRKKNETTKEIVWGTGLGMLLVVLLDRGVSTMIVAIPTAIVVELLLILLSKMVSKKLK